MKLKAKYRRWQEITKFVIVFYSYDSDNSWMPDARLLRIIPFTLLLWNLIELQRRNSESNNSYLYTVINSDCHCWCHHCRSQKRQNLHWRHSCFVLEQASTRSKALIPNQKPLRKDSSTWKHLLPIKCHQKKLSCRLLIMIACLHQLKLSCDTW